ncbi:hypothetical protein JAAARDRAFT_195293 [Jaapia argillacea MUCL 33604]|uniref:F-box domain-containing protein n=1 Tax=Jaapia argillacea MUCL 33604 TaxID=933084 RepID=A0A067PXS0_9AGAM|nr:hypothetical protein JAAARDRAFT_195293 [Jaapia argillacea MUCL 33604]
MPRLSRLWLRQIYWDGDGEEFTGWEPLRLKFLNVGSVQSRLLPWLARGHLGSGVESLTIEPISLENIPLIGDLLRLAGASLNRLNIGFGSGGAEDVLLTSSFALGHNNNLRHLGLTACDLSLLARHSRSHSWIPLVLSQVRSEIQTISMTFYFLQRGDNVAWINWNAVDAILATEFFKKLESFEIDVDHRCDIEGGEAWSTFKSLLPILVKRPGILRLRYLRTGIDDGSEVTYA